VTLQLVTGDPLAARRPPAGSLLPAACCLLLDALMRSEIDLADAPVVDD
jgi:hypothetical protein